MRCETVRRMADAFRTGETSRSVAERIRAHLRCCIACSRYMLFLGSLAAAVQGVSPKHRRFAQRTQHQGKTLRWAACCLGYFGFKRKRQRSIGVATNNIQIDRPS